MICKTQKNRKMQNDGILKRMVIRSIILVTIFQTSEALSYLLPQSILIDNRTSVVPFLSYFAAKITFNMYSF